MTHPSLLATLAAVAPLLATSATAAPQGPREPDPVTFTEHIAPIVFEHCASCHRPGEIGPFPLLTYRDVRKRARMIQRVTRKRYMPPWHPVPGHGDFKDDRRLEDEQIALIEKWVKNGRPEGDPKKLPELPKFTDGWQLGKPDLVVSMPAAFPVPASGPDIYRNFYVPLDLDRDRWVTAVEVRPSARTVLHHTLFYLDDTGTARRADGRDGKPGFRGMGFRSAKSLGGWAVGATPRHLPQGLAMHLPKGSDLVLASHFHLSGKKEREQTKIGLHFAKKRPSRSMALLQIPAMFGAFAGISIPAGESEYVVKDSAVIPVDCEAVRVSAHAHYILKSVQITATPSNGRKASMFYIDNWDFDWQGSYMYESAVPLPAGTKVEVTLIYDNSAQNPNNQFDPPRRVRWGPQSTDEMGSATLTLVPVDERDADELKRGIRDAMRRGMVGGRSLRGLRGQLIERILALDKDGDGVVQKEEIPRQYRRWIRTIDTNGDGELSKEELDAARGGETGGSGTTRRRRRGS